MSHPGTSLVVWHEVCPAVRYDCLRHNGGDRQNSDLRQGKQLIDTWSAVLSKVNCSPLFS